VVAYFGDATGNGLYSGLDAQRVARIGVGLDSGLSAYPAIDPVIVGDVTGNGGLSGLDAQRIARKAVGLPVPEIPDLRQPLKLDSPPAARGLATPLSASQLAPVLEAAVSRTVTGAGDRAAELLRQIAFEIVDLPGDLLGAAIDRRISIDVNAAGHGWFVEKYEGRSAKDEDIFFLSGSRLSALDSRLFKDLLTVVLHELGHFLGREHADDGLMDDRLPVSTRRLPYDSLFDLGRGPFDELEDVDVTLGQTAVHQDTLDAVFAQLER
jgi:hypothetical protein